MSQPLLVFDPPRRGKPPTHLSDLDLAGRAAAVEAAGLPAYRAKQVSNHWFARLSDDPAQWSDIPADLRVSLSVSLCPPLLSKVREVTADRGTTVKTLWKLHDGALVESVLMRYPAHGRSSERNTVCVSSQAGCGMNCPFCATGQAGLTRNLSTAEIVEQVLAAARSLARGEVAGGPGRLSNVVFMGMGEPLANYNAVLAAVRRMIARPPEGIGLSARGITVSTVGLVPAMRKLAGEGLPVTLALSLHAPDDELRDDLIPVNTRWKVGEALDAAHGYFQATGRRVSIEYALMRDVNDQAWRADLLGKLLNERGRGWVHVNPIPLNEIKNSRFTRSRDEDMQTFQDRLIARGISTTMRDTRGSEIDAACGQLAAAE
ncbi:MAG: 23S rRNA (adenine(2503)-C(2))-methyltransferase RlmN [Candidatus Nanopelagicales bacterium]